MEINTQLNSKQKCTLAKGNHEKFNQITVAIAYRTMISDDQTKITDMPQLCLEHIFMYLDLEDLLNVVDANKYLWLAAQMPFSRKYTGRKIDIDRTVGYKYREYPRNLYVWDTSIKIYDLKMTFQLLRSFGQMITELELVYGPWFEKDRHSQEYHHILSYIYEFCAESLSKVSFSPLIWEYLEKPFLNVEDVTIHQSFSETSDLNTIFPKLHDLRFLDRLCSRYNNLSVVSVHCPNLHSIVFPLGSANKAFSDVLLSNSHIKSLEIFNVGVKNFSCLNYVKDTLRSLESLDIHFDNDLFENCDPIYFKTLKRLKVINYPIHTWELPDIPLLSDQLKEFILEGDSLYCHSFYDFLSQNPTIEKLIFNQGFYSTVKYRTLRGIVRGIYFFLDIVRLKNALPSLKEIVFIPKCFYLPVSFAISYMEKFDSLNKFSFHSHRDCENEFIARCYKRICENDAKFFTLERIKCV